jgi:predicted PurR-regulated permease PerM
VFGLWGISLALPLMAIVKVLIDHFKAEEPFPETATA